MRRALIFPSLSLLLIAATPTLFGGWAVITVHDLPEYLVAGRPTTLAFTIRQHGVEPMDGLSPTVTIRQKTDRRVRGVREVAARPAGASGRYEAVLGPADTGRIELTIDANWHTARIALLPIPVLAQGATAAPLPAADFGRQLFIAKGCVSCHSKRDDRVMVARNESSVGPDLTGRGFAADWLAAKLADPAKSRVRFNEHVLMPDLGLSEREIGALVAYVNRQPADPVATTR
jgi:mono/diheme cytochrome c family protein